VTQFPPWSSHSPVCTITAVSKDLVRRPTRISYDLSLATLSHELGCLLADSGTIAGKFTRPVADALVCSYYVRCVSTPEILADVSVNHSRTGAVKLLITRRDEPVRLSSSGGTVRRTTACPGGRNWAAIQPRSKRMTRLAPRVLSLRAVSWAMAGSRCANPDAGRATWPRPGLFVDRTMYPVLASATAPAIAVRSRLVPHVDGVAGRIQRSELLPSRDACGPE